MAAKDFIVAIELGSSKITGIAGKKNSDGGIQVLAYAREDASTCIRRGVIYNLIETKQRLVAIVNELEGQLKAEIAKVYVGIGGQSLHSKKNFVVERLGRETLITEDIVQRLNRTNWQTSYLNMDLLDVVPQEYKVDNQILTNPVGVMGNQIEGHFLNIVANSLLKRNIRTCFEQAGIEIAGFLVSPMVLADAVLTDVEKRSGCMLVDIGYGTTTVVVYKNFTLRHLAVIPLGGNNITKDICSLNIEEDEAERLKCNYGSGFTQPGVTTDEDTSPVNDMRSIPAKELNDIVSARTEEIVANVFHQLELSGYKKGLPAGIVLTGGGANLNNLQQAFAQKDRYVKMRIASCVSASVDAPKQEFYMQDGRLNTILALLAAGKENCCSPEKVEEMSDMFKQSEDDEQAKRDEDERKRLAAEAQAKAEAAKKEEEQRKKDDEIRRNANIQALNKVKEAVDAVEQVLNAINEGYRKIEEAETNNSKKDANDAYQDVLRSWQAMQTICDKARSLADSVTDDPYQTEARHLIADVDNMLKAALNTKEEAFKKKEDVRKKNSFVSKGMEVLERFLNEDK